MTKTSLYEEVLDQPHAQTRAENLLHPEWNGATEREFGALQAMDDEAHRSRLRNIATESIFIDLLNTDEFLKKQDPEEVLEAYNDLLEVNPSLRNKKMKLRQALREYLATESLDLATIGQLEKSEADDASRRDANKRLLAEQANQFEQQRQAHESDLANLELKREELEQKKREAHDRASQAKKEMKHKKKELKLKYREFANSKEEFSKLMDERAKRYEVEDEAREEEMAYRQEQDDIRNQMAREEFEHRKSQDEIRNELDAERQALSEEEFEHTVSQDEFNNDIASTRSALEEEAQELALAKAENEKTLAEAKLKMDAATKQMQALHEERKLQFDLQAKLHELQLKTDAENRARAEAFLNAILQGKDLSDQDLTEVIRMIDNTAPAVGSTGGGSGGGGGAGAGAGGARIPLHAPGGINNPEVAIAKAVEAGKFSRQLYRSGKIDAKLPWDQTGPTRIDNIVSKLSGKPGDNISGALGRVSTLNGGFGQVARPNFTVDTFTTYPGLRSTTAPPVTNPTTFNEFMDVIAQGGNTQLKSYG